MRFGLFKRKKRPAPAPSPIVLPPVIDRSVPDPVEPSSPVPVPVPDGSVVRWAGSVRTLDPAGRVQRDGVPATVPDKTVEVNRSGF